MFPYKHIYICVDICTCIVVYIMRMFFFLCVCNDSMQWCNGQGYNPFFLSGPSANSCRTKVTFDEKPTCEIAETMLQ